MKIKHDKFAAFVWEGSVMNWETGQKQPLAQFEFTSHIRHENGSLLAEIPLTKNTTDNTVSIEVDSSQWADGTYEWNVAIFKNGLPMTTQEYELEIYAGATHVGV